MKRKKSWMSKEYNIRINKTKIEIMLYDRNERTRANLTINNDALQDVKEFTYLGKR